MTERAYVPDLDRALAPGSVVTLDGPEAHHLGRVRRARRGDRALLFDGAGRERWAEVREVGRSEVDLGVLDDPTPGRMPRLAVGVAVAPPKGKRMRVLLEKLTELAAAAIVPLSTERGVVDPAERAEHKQGKWRQATIEAAKQSGALWLPALTEPLGLREALQHPARLRVLLDPMAPAGLIECVERGMADAVGAGGGLAEVHAGEPADPLVPPSARLDVLILIGPEGGFTPAERAAAEAAGALAARLGPTILRVETAAMVGLGALLVRFG